jgi:transposase-like protein
MAQRGQRTSYQQRIEIGERAAAGERDREIAQAMGCSVWTVRKWRRTYKRQDRAGLVSHMGRPAGGALASCSSAVRERIAQLRREHPGWGAPSILDHLQQQEPELATSLPSRARVAAYIKEQGLSRRYERHGGVAQPAAPDATQVHEEWELDAQGAQPVAGLGQVSVINISDVVSRVKVASYPQPGTHLDWRTYQLALRCAFVQYGLPVRISLDHDSAWYDNTSQSPFPSRLHLWLVALGVTVVFIAKPPPAAHAIIERTHQTMSGQALRGQTWASQAALWYGLDLRREAVNDRLPCRSLAQQPPLVAYPQAAHPQRPYRLEWEEELLDLRRIDALLATGRWFRQSSCHGEFWLGMQRYNQGRTCAKSTIEITFDPDTREILTRGEGSDITKRFGALGLTKADLMGDLTTICLPNYQFSLPFTPQAWREMELAAQLAGTTL